MFRNEDEARAALATGTATPEDLNEIVATYPQLRPTVATYPATYPALMDWLAELSDPAIDQALVQRRATATIAPDADATTLQQLATGRPDLLPAILQHPNCYPELATWITQQLTTPPTTASHAATMANTPETPAQQPTTPTHSKLTAGDVTKGLGGVAAEFGTEVFQRLLTYVILGGAVVICAFIGRAIDGPSPGGATLVGVMAGFIIGSVINYKRGYDIWWSA